MQPAHSLRILLGCALIALLTVFAVPRVGATPLATVYIVDNNGDAGDADLSDKACKTAGGTCTLRAAIEQANAFVDEPITIAFNYKAPITFTPQSAYPPITRPIVIDGTNALEECPDGGTPAALNIVISGIGAGGGTSGLTLAAGSSGSTLRGLVITGFGGYGVDIQSDNNTLTCSHIGINRTGNGAAGNAAGGVRISGSNNTIGGTSPDLRNVISGNAADSDTPGVHLTAGSANSVRGNYIGSDANAKNAVPNAIGILADAGSATIGGTASGRNIISGNSDDGIRSFAVLTVAHNYIGTDGGGSSALGNGGNGIANYRRIANFGNLTAHNNVISANGAHGVSLLSVATLYANIIGMQANGTSALGNGGYGIFAGPHVEYSGFDPDNALTTQITIGGNSAAERNVIAGNSGWQIYLSAVSLTGEFNQHIFAGTLGWIRHNYIGLSATGGGDGPVEAGGIHIPFASDLEIRDNAIVGGFTNAAIDVTCTGSRFCTPAGNNPLPALAHQDVLIADNTIGTNPAGTTALNHGAPAVVLRQAGALTLRDNVIGSAAADYDVLLTSGLNWGGTLVGSQDNLISDNIIGIAGDASRDLNSGVIGLAVSAHSHDNIMEGNAISADGGHVLQLLGDANTLRGNWLGTDAGQTLAAGGTVGLYIAGDANSVHDNVIAFNTTGVQIEGSANNDFYGNGIGTDPAGTADLGNSGVGVLIGQGSSGNRLGGDAARAFNQVRFNGSHGVQINDTDVAVSGGNTLYATLYADNGGLAIELGNDGVTANDGSDGDNGPNALQNHPLILGLAPNGDVSGTLNSRSNTQFRIDVYQSLACDPSGYGEGAQFYGSAIVQTSGFNAAFSISPAASLLPLPALTAIATNLSTGDSSEFSACFNNPDALNFVVNSTADSVAAGSDGRCDVDAGTPGLQCTLREALTEINALARSFPISVTFDLPAGSVIQPTQQLPQINAPVVIDGFSAGSANGCTPTHAAQPIIGVTLDGGNDPNSGIGLLLHNDSDGSIIRGLAVTNFDAQGIFVGGSGTLNDLSANTQIYCNLIGVAADGSDGGNGGDGVRLGGVGHSVSSNIIGFNGDNGIEVGSSQPGTIRGNAIGTNFSGSADYGNAGDGIEFTNGSYFYAVGDPTGAQPNLIHNNAGAGIRIGASGSGRNSLYINSLRNNGGLGIDLGALGVTPNDPGDGDSGYNDLQNYPLLSGHDSCSIEGSLNSRSARDYRIDVYHTTSCAGNPSIGEGETWFGAITVTTDAAGDVTFSVPSADDTTGYPYFVATATDLTTGDTSEFSACYAYSSGVPTQITLAMPGTAAPVGGHAPAALSAVALLALLALTGWAARRRRMALLLLLAAVAGTLAFGGRPPVAAAPASAEAPQSCTVISGVLDDGGVVSGDGLIVGTVPGSLAAPVGLTLAAIAPPVPAYDDAATVVGSYYRLSAQTTLTLSPETPLIIAIPIPPAANPDDLMVAVYSDRSRSTHGGDGYDWAHFQLYHDTAGGMMTWTRSELPAEGLTFVLVEHSTFDTLPDPVRAADGRMVDITSFQITCMFVNCTNARRTAYETALLNAYNDFTAHGFRPPLLKNVVATVPSSTPGSTQIFSAQVFYGVKVRPTSPQCVSSDGVSYAGIYHPAAGELEICDSAVPISAFTQETIRHELFHAVQYAYPAINQPSDWGEQWVIEGTAAAAEHSSATMARSAVFDWRKIGTRLTAQQAAGQTLEYDAQDFWVYHGLAAGQGLGYLHTIFENGIEVADIDHRLPNGYTLASGYWEWIKNQAFERVIGYDGELVGSCLPSDGVLGAGPDLVTPVTTLTHDVGSGCTQSSLVQQGRLTSALYTIEFSSGEPTIFDVDISIVPTSPDPLLVFKVYDPAEAACWSGGTGSRTFSDVTLAEQRYVLVSNARSDRTKSYRVQVCDVSGEG